MIRRRHLIAYSCAMISLLVWQLLFYLKAFSGLSDFHSDLVYTLGSQVLCMGLIPAAVLLIVGKGNFTANRKLLRYQPPRDKKACLLICVAVMLLITPFTMVFNALTNLFFRVIGYKRVYPVGTIYLGVGDFFLMLFFSALLPAVFEEFCHRGILLSGLEDHGSEYSAVILSGVFFGLMHANPAQFVYAVFGGMLFAVLVIKTNSILPAICAHFANNAVATFLDYSTQRGTAFGRFYDKITSGASILSFGVTVLVLALSVYAVIKLMQYAARKAPKPIVQRKLLGTVTLDGYVKNGKPTLCDNACLIALAVAEGLLTAILLIWGVAR